ncbi:hypothetical protein VTK73DRAFT_6078 [Phialemonium thermophilum]|uniref:ABC transporter domain-containing protein n=1 Tax=Phialemonium thermophilum TaxID=223376 RepID=A0ABR3WL15_9PEZI
MIAVLSMVTHPANMVMTIVPRAIATAASFERVQAYLVSSPRTDSRTITSEGVVVTTSTISDAATSSRPVVRFEHVTIDRPAGHGSAPILRDVRFEITEDHPFAFCSGPVGSGKSVLARAVLGELPPSRGTIEVRLPEGAGARIGFCAQSSWLPEGSIRDVVVLGDRDEWDGGMDRRSGAGVDVQRYEEAIRACCLDYDIASLPEGDHTLVGSRGMNVSGGQRQRLVSPGLSTEFASSVFRCGLRAYT